MTDDHAHCWQLGDLVDGVVEGRCPCGAVREYAAFIPAGATYKAHHARPTTPEQREESRALMSHARSLLAKPR